MTLYFQTDAGSLEVPVSQLVIAGWSGRDRDAVEHHIDELAALGVPRPSTVPLYYRVSHQLLTQSDSIDVVGECSSGEVEPVLVRHRGEWWLTVGSDHTDRALEAHSVALSKQLCAKPVASRAWRWSEVADDADALQLSSQIFEDGAWVAYQSGAFSSLRPLMSLVDGYKASIDDGFVIFCGTLSVMPNARSEAIRPAAQMRLALHDLARSRTIEHAYRVASLPLVS